MPRLIFQFRLSAIFRLTTWVAVMALGFSWFSEGSENATSWHLAIMMLIILLTAVAMDALEWLVQRRALRRQAKREAKECR